MTNEYLRIFWDQIRLGKNADPKSVYHGFYNKNKLKAP